MKRLLFIALCAASLAPGPSDAITRHDGSLPDGAGVTLRMSLPEASVLNPGEEVAFHYQTGDDALVVIFNIDTEGYVHLLNAEDATKTARALQTYTLPSATGESLVVSGETGVEFVFAMTIPDPSFLDASALSYLAESDSRPADQRYRISGDPFLAANIVAADLVRGISRRDGVFLDYTHFFVNQRVDFPCYLCNACDGATGDTDCDRYRIAIDLDHERPLTYPLKRAYQMTEPAVAQSDRATEDVAGDEVDIEFYPYNSRIRGYSTSYVYRVYDPWYYDTLYWDPWFCGWGYYPAYSGWGFTMGWGAGWYGGWGGYYCSRGYDPWWGGYDSYAGYSTRYPAERFKSKFKTGGDGASTLTAARRTSLRRDSDLQIASRDIRTSRRLATVRVQPAGRGDVASRSGYRARTSRASTPARVHGTRATVDRKTSGRSVRNGNNRPAAKPRASRPARQQPAARPQSGTARAKSGEARSGSGSRTKSPSSSSGAKARNSGGAKNKGTSGSKSSGSSSRSGKAKGGKR